MKNVSNAERSADIQSSGGADISAYTEGDLISAIEQWQIDADYIFAICEDLPHDSLERACAKRFGEEGGDHLIDWLVSVHGLSPINNA